MKSFTGLYNATRLNVHTYLIFFYNIALFRNCYKFLQENKMQDKWKTYTPYLSFHNFKVGKTGVLQNEMLSIKNTEKINYNYAEFYYATLCHCMTPYITYY